LFIKNLVTRIIGRTGLVKPSSVAGITVYQRSKVGFFYGCYSWAQICACCFCGDVSMLRNLALTLRALTLVAFSGLAVCDAAVAQPIPNVTFGGASSVFLNSKTDLRVAFNNPGTKIGYYPMIEVKLPAGLECDTACRAAIALVDLGGAPVTVTRFGPAASNTTFKNPVTGNPVSAAKGETVLFISLPTGSVSPTEPAITYSIPAQLAPSAVLGVPLPVSATGVFVLGGKADGIRGVCGAAGVDTLCKAATNFPITPTVLDLKKSVIGLVDGATATGPNYPRQYSLDVKVADTETVEGTVVTDTVPESFVFSTLPGSDCKAKPGSMKFNPALDTGDTCKFVGNATGGGSFEVKYASITGDGNVVRQVQYEGYVQKFTGAVAGADVVPPSTGNATSTTTSAEASFTYDPGSGAQNFNTGLKPATLEHRSLYTTKSIKNVSSTLITAPGHTLRHTLIYDVSDYFSFDDLKITDSISDGQTYVSGSLSVTVEEASAPGITRTEAQLLAIVGSPLQPITRDPASGIWSVALDLSAALVASGPDGFGAPDGMLEGDENRSPSAPSGSPTRVVITYDTVIDEEFVGPVVGTPEVDGGDVISDTMGADFRLAGTANRQTMNGPTASIRVTPILVFKKEVAFENGGTPSDPLRVNPTETITYKLSFEVPTGDVEGLLLRDFVPSPLFDVADPDGDGVPSGFTFDTTPSDAAPAPGVVHLTTASADVAVVVTAEPAAHAVAFSFDRETNASSTSTLIELMFTVTATSAPMADDLLLVNVAYLFQNSSQSLVPINQLSSVAPLLTSQPKIVVRKAAASVVSGGGSVQGTGANANFVGVQPGARLRFSVELQNAGSFGAVDVSMVDPLPAPFTLVAGSVVTTNCDTAGGVTDTSSPTEVNLSSMEIPAGQICSIEYQVDLDPSAKLGAVVTNTATSRYASTPGGPLFAPEKESATTTVNAPTLTKTLVAGSSSDSETAEGSLRAGESALFDVVISVPPGTADSFTVREIDAASGSTSPNFFENFEAGSVIFPSIEKNSACGGDFNFVGNPDLCFTSDPNTTSAQANATTHQVNLGSVRNLSGTSQSFTFKYRATVRGGIVAGAYVNRANVQWVTQNSSGSGSTPGTVTSMTATAPFNVVRPVLTLAKTTTTSSPVKAGQEIEYVLTLRNTGGSSAHDVANIVDTLPTGLGAASLVSATLNGASVTGASGFNFSQAGSQLVVTVRNSAGIAKLAAGDVYVVTFKVPLSDSLSGSTTSLVNIAQVASYATGASDGGPRETLTDVPQASVAVGVNSSNIYGRAVFSKETAGSTTQNGVAGATVTILGTSFTTTTDSNGNFSFSGVPNGTYTIKTVSAFGDVIGEETVVVNNADVHNVVFQARPRIVLTKSTTTVGPVTAGQSIDYTLKLENVGNYPAFQIANIIDMMVKGMEKATLVSAKHSGVDVTKAPGFSFQQSGLMLTVSVRNPAGEARLNPGQNYVVSYRVAVSTTLKGVSITIPNSATIASYSTTATNGSTTETFVDVRCGHVRLDLTDDTGPNVACTTTSLASLMTSVETRSEELRRGVSRALALRKQYAAAGYCKAKDNGCFKCNANRSKCINVCRMPSSREDQAMAAKAAELDTAVGSTVSDKLVSLTWALECTSSMVCAMSDMADPKGTIADSSRQLADMTNQILDSCCLRTSRASKSLKQRRASLRQAAKRDLKQMNTHMAEYPSPALICR
jgi:fimbrial isopeptide formation D2 family protein/uncharacterized repeat protein (TIGR01451 family)